jgi:hypothetical protein
MTLPASLLGVPDTHCWFRLAKWLHFSMFEILLAEKMGVGD